MSDRKPVVVVGSINMDLVTTAERIPLAGETVAGTGYGTHAGGKGANQAVAIARLGYPVRMIGRVGSDRFGAELLRGLKLAGVETSGVKTVEGNSGVAVILVSAEGENCIVVTPGANERLRPEDLDGNRDALQGAAAVLAQLEIPLDTVLRLAEICAEYRVPLILDPAPAQDLPSSLLARATWFTPNETEATYYVRDAVSGEPAGIAQALRSLGAANVLLKRGAQGFYLATADGRGEAGAAYRVRAIDTTAAGDTFNGAFAVALATGRSPSESARFAARAAAISVTRHGAQDSMPSLDEVERFLSEQGVP